MLCDALQNNIVNVIFVEDGSDFYFYFPGGSWCQNLRLLCWITGKHTSNWRRYTITWTFEVTMHVSDAGQHIPSTYQIWTSYAFLFQRCGWLSVHTVWHPETFCLV